MIDPTPWITSVHLATTMFMVGLIWFVQLVHYPLMAAVGRPTFETYHHGHLTRTTKLVLIPMTAEVVVAVLLVFPWVDAAPLWLTVPGIVLLGLIWISTFVLQAPCHKRLENGFDVGVHHRLVRTNWIRTVAWSLRGVLAIAVSARIG